MAQLVAYVLWEHGVVGSSPAYSTQLLRMRKSEETKYLNYINRWKCGEESGMRGRTGISRHIRRYLFDRFDNKCCKCGWGKTNPTTNSVPLEVDHIDGDHTNNNESNLELLCPNCHSLTPTYKSLNKGKGRPGR